MTRILILQHEDNAGPGRFGRWWAEAGADVVVVDCARQPVPGTLDDVDALVVLGGSMGATDDDVAWLPSTRARIRDAVAAGLPTLGICLGQQLMAVALGGRVERAPRVLLGLQPFLRTEAGRTDPVTGVLVDPVLAVHYNGDQVAELPPGAEALGRTPDGQLAAVRFAPRAWGFQSHPEVDEAGFRAWTVDKPAGEQPASVVPLADLARAVVESEPTQAAQWRRVADAFLAEVRGPR